MGNRWAICTPYPREGKQIYNVSFVNALVEDSAALTVLEAKYNAFIDVETYDSVSELPATAAANTVAKVSAGAGYTKHVFYDGEWVQAFITADAVRPVDTSHTKLSMNSGYTQIFVSSVNSELHWNSN